MRKLHIKDKIFFTNRGFTLIELMVSIALFSVVVVVVATAYLNLLSLDRQARATNDIADNLNFVIDTMARSIRTGTNYQCGVIGGPNCPYPTSNSYFSFKDDQGNTDTYILDAGNHQIGECPNQVGTCSVGSGTYQVITDPGITISSLSFYVDGVGNGGAEAPIQPHVTFVVQGYINVDPQHAPVTFDIQSSATQRQIDI